MQFTFKEVIQAAITLIVLGIFAYATLTGKAMNEQFNTLLIAIVAFWFGLQQITDIVASAVNRKRNGSYPNTFKG